MTSRIRILVLLLFVLSGFTSLVYQAIWIRLISLAVGSTSASMGLVLSIFFSGLAAGSYLCGQMSGRIKKPLLVYGILESLIGLYSILLVKALLGFHHLMVFVYPDGSLNAVSHAVKFFLVFAMLIAPTLCMGASLPLLIRLFTTGNAAIGKSVSLLYGINTIGAVLGAFAAGFWLIPAVGVEYANHVSAFLNVCILGICLWTQRTRNEEFTLKTEIPSAADKTAARAESSRGLEKALLLATGLSGFSSIVAEVVWNKYLGIFMGTNLFGLSLILSLFLLGIAVGSFLLSRVIDRLHDPIRFLIWLLISAIVATFVSTVLLSSLPILANLVAHYVPVLSLLVVKSILTGLLLFLPTVFFGALFPLTISVLTRKSSRASASTGRVYAINTIGAVLGSYLAGIVLIPWLGSAFTLKIALLVLSFAALLVLIASGARGRRRFVPAGLLAAIAISIVLFEGIQFRNIVRSAYRQSLPKETDLAELLKLFSSEHEEFQLIVEGQTAVISLSHDQNDGENYRRYYRLKTNGLNESIYNREQLDVLPKYEALLGLLPYTLVRDPQNAFIVGYGGGYSVDFLTSTDLKKVFVAELERGILQAADYVYQGKNPILGRKNLDLRIEDARFILTAGTNAPFDIIASQPSHSWLSGVANLFTKEFFELVKSRLKPAGVFSQWLNLYNMSPEVLKSILRTFYTTFPHGAVFTNLHDEELILIGSKEPIQFNVQKVNAVLRNPKIANQVSAIPLRNAYDLLSQMSFGREQALQFSASAPINSDRNAFAEVYQSKLFYRTDDRASIKSFIDSQFKADYSAIAPDGFLNRPENLFGILDALGSTSSYHKINVLLDSRREQIIREAPARLAMAFFQQERYASAYDALTKEKSGIKTEADVALALSTLLYLNRVEEAARVLKAHSSVTNGESLCLRLTAYELAGEPARSAEIAARLERDPAKGIAACGPTGHLHLGSYYFRRGKKQKALAHLEAYYAVHPQSIENLEMLIASLIEVGQKDRARSFIDVYPGVLSSERERIEALENYYRARGAIADADALAARVAHLRRPGAEN